MAKAKAARPSKVRSIGLACLLAISCAAGGYYLGKSNGNIEDKIAALMSSAKNGAVLSLPAKPAPETVPEPKHVEARSVKPAEKIELTHLIKTSAEPKTLATLAAPTEEKEQPPLSITMLGRDTSEAAAEAQNDPNKVTLAVNFQISREDRSAHFEGVLNSPTSG